MPITLGYVATTHIEHTIENQNINLFSRFIAKHNAKNQAKSIMKGLEQAKAIKEGKIKAQSFEDAIRGL